MIIYCDIDGVICTQDPKNPSFYQKAKPIQESIDKINKLYDEGNSIILWTSRGVTSTIDWEDFTKKQLEVWGVKYHRLRMKKPYYNIFIDDKSFRSVDEYTRSKR